MSTEKERQKAFWKVLPKTKTLAYFFHQDDEDRNVKKKHQKSLAKDKHSSLLVQTIMYTEKYRKNILKVLARKNTLAYLSKLSWT